MAKKEWPWRTLQHNQLVDPDFDHVHHREETISVASPNSFTECPQCGGPLTWNEALKCWVCEKCNIVVGDG